MEKSYDTQDKTSAMEDDEDDEEMKAQLKTLFVLRKEGRKKVLACPVENCEYARIGKRYDLMAKHLREHKCKEKEKEKEVSPNQKWFKTFNDISGQIEEELDKSEPSEPISKAIIYDLLHLVKSTMRDLYMNISDREEIKRKESQRITKQVLELGEEDTYGLTLEQRIRKLEINNNFQNRIRDLYREQDGDDYDLWVQDFKHRASPKVELCKIDSRINLVNKKMEEMWNFMESEFRDVYWDLDRLKDQFRVPQNERGKFINRCNSKKRELNGKFVKIEGGVKDFKWTDKNGNRPKTNEEKEQDKKEFDELYSLFKLYRDKDEIPAGVSKGAIGEYVTLRHFVGKPYHPRAKSVPYISRFDMERITAPDPAPLPKLLP